jgi:hypothetical protein
VDFRRGGKERQSQCWPAGLFWENSYESAGISKKDLPELQNSASQACAFRYLPG